MNSKLKLCYVMPEYDPSAYTHFAYLTDFIKAISKHFDIFLLIERGTRPDDNLGCRYVSIVFLNFPMIRFVEIKLKLLFARLLGYRTFYIHYSFFSAFIASFLGRTFYWNCGEPWKYKRNSFRDWFERLVYQRIDFLVTGTENLKSRYAAKYGLPLRKVKVMTNWINLSKLKDQKSKLKISELRTGLNISTEQKVILFVHRLSKRKGAHHLPELARELNTVNHDSPPKAPARPAGEDKPLAEKFIILVIGDGPERKDIEAKIKNYELGNKVRFLGRVHHEELAKYYAIADVFIMPSEEEGFPHVLLEAMAFGLPFVAFDVGGIKEIIPPELLLYIISPGNTREFLEKLCNILALPKEKLDMLCSAEISWVKRYDLDKIVAEFVKLFT